MSTSINQHFTPWALLKFAFPSIVMMLFMSLYTIVDGVFIAQSIMVHTISQEILGEIPAKLDDLAEAIKGRGEQ